MLEDECEQTDCNSLASFLVFLSHWHRYGVYNALWVLHCVKGDDISCWPTESDERRLSGLALTILGTQPKKPNKGQSIHTCSTHAHLQAIHSLILRFSPRGLGMRYVYIPNMAVYIQY